MGNKSTDWTGLTLSDGRYRFQSKLGEGGMGIVYHAHDTRLGMDVVIKVPRQAMLDDPAFADRFAREIRSLVRLSHPNIVKVTDVGVHEGLPFAVMQYLPGGSLEDRQPAAADGPAPAPDARSLSGWLTGVAAALDYIHSQGYVHRDVKPGNILFDTQGHAFLGDFGVIKALASSEKARAAERSATASGLVLGTPEYMAPELIMGVEVDGRVDQYALAVTLYEMLCGRRPFEGPTPTAVLVLHTTRAPVALSELRPGIPGRLSQAVLKGLAKEPSGRYPSCSAFAAAVVAALEAGPAAAPGPAGSESVKIQCLACGKKVTLAPPAYANLKRTGRSFPCPGCQLQLPVTGEGIRILSLPQAAVEREFAPGGTQEIATHGPASGTQKIATPGPGSTTQKLATPGPVAATQKIATTGPRPATQKIASTGQAGGQRAATMKIDALNPVVSGGPESHTRAQAGQGKTRTKSSPVPWIVAGAAAALAIASVLYLQSGGSAPKSVPVVSTPPADGPDRPVPRSSRRDLQAQREPTPAPLPVDRSTPTASPAPEATAFAGREPGDSASPTPKAKAKAKAAEAVVVAEKVAVAPGPTVGSNQADTEESAPAVSEKKARGPVTRKAAPTTSLASNAQAPGAGAGAGATSRKASLSLGSLLQTPEKYADQDVIPGGLYVLGPTATLGADGTVSIPAVEGSMTVSSTGVIAPKSRGSTATLDIDPRLAQGMIAKNLLQYDGLAPAMPTLQYVAILTVRVIKSTARYSANNWLLHLVRAEFLVNLDLQRISDQKYGHSFHTFTIGDGAESVGVGNPDEWKARLGQHFLVQTGKAFKRFKNQMLAARAAAMNSIIGGMINQAVENATEQEAIRQGEINNIFRPREAVDGMGTYQDQVQKNIELRRP